MASTTQFFLIGLSALVLAFWFYPILVLALILFICELLFKMYKRARPELKALSNKIEKNLRVRLGWLRYFSHIFWRKLKNGFFGRIAHFENTIYQELFGYEIKRLIKKINKRTDITAWLVPTIFWPEIKSINAKTVVIAPDIIYLDFPTLFTCSFTSSAYKKMVMTLSAANHLVCYSEHVRQKHILEPFGIEPSKVSLIKHGFVDLSSHLIKNTGPSQLCKMRQEALQILIEYQQKSLQHHLYLRDFDFTSVQFIFYSSQVRHHKNYISLIKAYEILLRKRFLNIKLIVTGNLSDHQEILSYILNKRLQYDIISLPNVSSTMLAALNHLAVCSVNPTLFEGGFPFTFTEAYSVGTPSVMSSIPVVTAEIEDEKLRSKMLFDPYDLDDIVNKIEWAVKNRESLYHMQEPLFAKFKQRDWHQVAKEYIDLLQSQAAT